MFWSLILSKGMEKSSPIFHAEPLAQRGKYFVI